MPSLNHTHTYVKMDSRRRARQSKFFKCDDPKCTHYAPRDLVLGKESLCSVCHETVIVLTREDLQRANPRCFKCSNTKQAKKSKAISELFSAQGINFDEIDSIKNS